MKKCSKCNELKLKSEFWKDSRLKSGLHSWCKSCCSEKRKEWSRSEKGKESTKRREAARKNSPKRKEWIKQYCQRGDVKERHRKSNIKWKFKITDSERSEIEENQKGVCAVCGRPEKIKRNGKTKRLAIDHNHNTERVRGLLCSDCNQALGLLKVDDLGILNLQMAIKYLSNCGDKK